MKDCITFMETNKNVSEQEVMSLYRVQERLTSERNKNLKQTTLKNFFKQMILKNKYNFFMNVSRIYFIYFIFNIDKRALEV